MKKLIRNFNRMFKHGFLKSIRTPHIFLPLTLFFSIVLIIGSVTYLSFNFSSHLINKFEDKINIIVFFDRKVAPEVETKIVNKIKERTDVKNTVYKTGKEVLSEFKLKYKDDKVINDSLNELSENPFGSSLVVYAENPNSYEVISKEILDMNTTFTDEITKIIPIEEVTYANHKVAIDKFANMLNKGSLIASIISVVLTLILVFTLYLALRFALLNDREEIKIMKLVGASSMLTVGPITIMAMLAGFLGSIVSIILMYFITQNITPYTLAFDNFNAFTWYVKNIHIFIVGNILAGLILGFIGSILATKKYL